MLFRSGLSAYDNAVVARMMASADWLLNTETGLRHFNLAEKALTAARKADDRLLIAQALFEFARSGAESGDDSRVQFAYRLVSEMLELEENRSLPMAHYTQGYCLYYLYDAERARVALEKTIMLLKPIHNPIQLSLAYTGLGNCLRALCDIDGSQAAFENALALAKRMGNDSRASIIAGNIVALLLIKGDYEQAIRIGLNSVEYGNRALSQPFLSASYMNLAEAYALRGEAEKDRKSTRLNSSHIQKSRMPSSA